MLLTHGWRGYRKRFLADLGPLGVRVITTRVAALEGRGRRLHRVRFEDGSDLASDALFFATGTSQTSAFATKLGCRVSKNGSVLTDRAGHAGGKCVYVIGDSSHDSHFVAVAVAEGAKAALAIQAERERLRHPRHP